jgi:ketosteroid isomerase-like protein
MASANLDVVRSIMASFEHGDYFALAGWAHPEIEWVRAGGPDPDRAIGLAGMERATRGVFGAWDEHCTEADEYRELNPERVLVLCTISGRGKTSGLSMRAEAAIIFDLRDRKVTRCVSYMHRDQALADLGLAPEGEAADRPD